MVLFDHCPELRIFKEVTTILLTISVTVVITSISSPRSLIEIKSVVADEVSVVEPVQGTKIHVCELTVINVTLRLGLVVGEASTFETAVV